MKTYTRTCIKDLEITADNGDRFNLKQGEKYLTSDIEIDLSTKQGRVLVLTKYWVEVPVSFFSLENTDLEKYLAELTDLLQEMELS